MSGPNLPPLLLPQSVAITFVVGLFYGFYLITVSYANRWLLFADEGWRFRKQINWFTVIITNLISTLLLADVALSVRTPMSQTAFVEKGHRPEEFTYPPWEPIVECMLANTMALLADIVLMYRLWVVYGGNLWVMGLPVFLWVGGIVCTVLQAFLQVAHIHNPNFGPYQWASVDMTMGPGIVLIPFWASTVVLNAYCTGLLIWKIQRVSKADNSDHTFANQLQFLVRILAESGILYLVISLAHFFVWFGKNNFAIHMIGSINSIVVAVAFNLILIRTAQNRAEGEEIKIKNEKLSTLRFNSKPRMLAGEDQSVSEAELGVYPTGSRDSA